MTVALSLVFMVGSSAGRAPVAYAADSLAELDGGALSVSVSAVGTGQYRVQLTPRGPQKGGLAGMPPQVFPIPNPSRLVIDVPGYSFPANRAQSISDRYLSGLRLGVHPDKARIVLDLAVESLPEFRIEGNGDTGKPSSILITFGSADGWAALVPSTPAPTPKAQPTPLATPKPKQTASPTPAEDEQDEPLEEPGVAPPEMETPEQSPSLKPATSLLQPTPLPGTEATSTEEPIGEPTPTSMPHRGGAAVKTILFQRTQNSAVPALVLDVPGLSSYTLNKQREDLYELVISKAKLGGTQLQLPQFPPEKFEAFNVVIARDQGADVLVKVYVQPGTKLFPFVAGDRLWLRSAK